MRKRPVGSVWLWLSAAGIAAVVAVLVWTQVTVKSLGTQLDQDNATITALAAQVRSMGGKPVAEGKPGAAGAVGPQGVQGPQGIQGVRGLQGPPGIQGPRGPIGITGQSPACLLEPTRCVGPPGTAGKTGSTGTAGKNGTNGVNGKDGATGATGPAGPPGPAGADGKPGADGKDGTNGTNGEDGRGVQSMTCSSSGVWVVTYTDDTTQTTNAACTPAVLPQVGK